MLDANVANTIIDTWMSTSRKELDAKGEEAEQAGDGTAAASAPKLYSLAGERTA